MGREAGAQVGGGASPTNVASPTGTGGSLFDRGHTPNQGIATRQSRFTSLEVVPVPGAKSLRAESRTQRQSRSPNLHEVTALTVT